jgi:hypothetical protein
VKRLTLDVKLGALVEETNALGARASTDEVGEESAKDARVDVGGVTGVDGLVAARELSLVTTLGLGLLDGHAVGNLEANVGVSLVADTIGVTDATGDGRPRRKGIDSGSEAEDNSGERELHFVGKLLKY